VLESENASSIGNSGSTGDFAVTRVTSSSVAAKQRPFDHFHYYEERRHGALEQRRLRRIGGRRPAHCRRRLENPWCDADCQVCRAWLCATARVTLQL
jgi:hypothetical protein